MAPLLIERAVPSFVQTELILQLLVPKQVHLTSLGFSSSMSNRANSSSTNALTAGVTFRFEFSWDSIRRFRCAHTSIEPEDALSSPYQFCEIPVKSAITADSA
jgi:hypothetical protein